MSSHRSSNAMPGQQNKRLACDRCRAQKLKCVRQEPSRMCQRCTAAGTNCTFGSPRPPGRPPTVQQNPNSKPTNSPMTSTAPSRQTGPAPTNMHFDYPPTGQTSQGFQNPMLPTTCNPPTPLSPVGPQMNAFDDDSIFNLLEDTVMEDFDMSSLDAPYPTPISDTRSMETSWQTTPQPPNPAVTLPDLLPRADISETSTSTTSPQKPASTSAISLDNLPFSMPPNLFQEPSQIPPPIDTNQRPPMPPAGDAVTGRNQRMQQLMHLGIVMCELQNVYSQDDRTLRPISFDTFPIEFAGKVLQAANTFLKSLQNFYFTDPSGSISSSSSSSLSRLGPQEPSEDDRSYPPPFNHYRVSSHSMSRASSAYASSESTESSARRVYATDKPATLQLIACYLRILQLYLLLHVAILEYVRSSEPESRRHQPIWNNLSLGDAPLYPFADFQIQLVLQVAMHSLEEIEAALGLPDGCRMSKKSPSEGNGILGSNVTSHFIEMCVSEVATGAEEGRSAIKRLKDIQGHLADLLDRSACF